jgi:hypothetical protein
MKVYVLGYDTREDHTPPPPPRPFTRLENIDVGYSGTPAWKMESLYEAEVELATLRRMDVHVGSHYCQFEVEALSEGAFALVCTNHPDHLKLATLKD